MAERLPDALRAEIARTLEPVAPLPEPRRRALLLAPVAAAVLVSVPLVWELRADAAAVGFVRLWGGSLLQIAVALAVLVVALAEAAPARLSSPRRLLGWALVGVACVLALTELTFSASPTEVPPLATAAYARVCLTRSFGLGLLPLGVAMLLIARGLAARPIVAGALSGLAAGLMADSGWRLFCEVSDPSHVLTAHAGAIAAVTLAGAAAGAVLQWSVFFKAPSTPARRR